MNRTELSVADPSPRRTEVPGAVDYGVLMPVEVYFDDIDVFGLLHNSRYGLLFERAWTAFWTGQGLGGESGREGDGFHVVKQFELIFDQPVTRPGRYAVHLWTDGLGRTSSLACFRVCSVDGTTTYAHGTRTVVRVDPVTFRPTPWSPKARQVVATIAGPRGDTD